MHTEGVKLPKFLLSPPCQYSSGHCGRQTCTPFPQHTLLKQNNTSTSHHCKSRDSSVGIATRLRDGVLKSRGSNPGKGSAAHPASMVWGLIKLRDNLTFKLKQATTATEEISLTMISCPASAFQGEWLGQVASYLMQTELRMSLQWVFWMASSYSSPSTKRVDETVAFCQGWQRHKVEFQRFEFYIRYFSNSRPKQVGDVIVLDQ
jgi:hypothetical protein